MLTRTDAAGTTQFVWDGMDCVMELGPDGTQTRYYVVQGELVMFERTPPGGSSATYQVLCDSMGSVRKVLSSTNVVVAQYDYDAWGALLPSSYDNVGNGGLTYRYVGAPGVRWDAGTGLYYMRQRWYDPTLQRFVSRDPLGNINRYLYCDNAPVDLIDPYGLRPRPVEVIEVHTEPRYRGAGPVDNPDSGAYVPNSHRGQWYDPKTQSWQPWNHSNPPPQEGVDDVSMVAVNAVMVPKFVGFVGECAAATGFVRYVRRIIPNLPRPPKPPLPPGIKNNGEFGNLVGWGGGNGGGTSIWPGLTRVTTVAQDIGNISAQGLTSEIANTWSQFYFITWMRQLDNTTAPGRWILMWYISKLL